MFHFFDASDFASTLVGGSRGARYERFTKQALTKRIEFEFDKQSFQFFFVPVRACQVVRFDLQRYFAVYRNQFFGKQRLFTVFFDTFLLFSFEFVHVVEQVFDASILSDQFLSGFLTHTRHTGHVVRTVAHQAQDVYYLIHAFDLPLFQDFFDALNFLVTGAPRFTDKGAIGDQLTVVLVGRNHVGDKAGFFRLFGERSDHIVRFPSGDSDNGQVERFAQAENIGKRHAEVLRHGLALSLVCGIHLVPVSRLRRVENNADMGGVRVAQNIQQGVCEHEYGGGIQAGGGHAGVADHGKMGPVNQRHSVQQVELFVCFVHCFLPTPDSRKRRISGVLIFLAIGDYATYLVSLIDDLLLQGISVEELNGEVRTTRFSQKGLRRGCRRRCGSGGLQPRIKRKIRRTRRAY